MQFVDTHARLIYVRRVALATLRSISSQEAQARVIRTHHLLKQAAPALTLWCVASTPHTLRQQPMQCHSTPWGLTQYGRSGKI